MKRLGEQDIFSDARALAVLLGWGSGMTGPPASVGEGPGIDVTPGAVGLGGDTVLLYDSGGDPVAEFAATQAGLTAALAAATSGDAVWLPAATIAGDHTLPAGVHVIGVDRRASVLTGQITGTAGASVQSLSIARTANDASKLLAVVAPDSGRFDVSDCDLTVTQSGAGTGYAVGVLNHGGDVYLYGVSGTRTTGLKDA